MQSKMERKVQVEIVEVRRYRRHLRSRSRMTFYKTVRLQSFRNARVYRVEHSEQEKDKKKKTYLKCGRIGPVENVVKIRRVGCF